MRFTHDVPVKRLVVLMGISAATVFLINALGAAPVQARAKLHLNPTLEPIK